MVSVTNILTLYCSINMPSHTFDDGATHSGTLDKTQSSKVEEKSAKLRSIEASNFIS